MIAKLRDLCAHHYERCEPYARILDAFGVDLGACESLDSLPFLPVLLFKELDLHSLNEAEIFKILRSSGTSGAQSKIFLDRATAAAQQQALVKIISRALGAKRLPMVIIDAKGALQNRSQFSARTAATLGFSIFGAQKFYALRDDFSVDIDGLSAFLSAHKGQKILFFGFTFMVWQFVRALQGASLPDFSGVLIHGGGWKKLEKERVEAAEFKQALRSLNIAQIHDYYGMVEQTGSIFLECESGFLHCNEFNDILIRNAELKPAKHGEQGIVQVFSTLPRSYPGHSLLTQDSGAIYGDGDCACGQKGKYFRIFGRLARAEVRGCSDV